MNLKPRSRLHSYITNSSGQALMIVIALLPFLVLAVFTTMQGWRQFSQKEKIIELNLQLKNIKDYIFLNLKNTSYWAQTVNHADNAGAAKMDCLKNNTSCSTKTSFTLIDTLVTDQGAINLSQSNLGFNIWNLAPCNQFNNGAGHPECIFRPEVYWRAICNDASCLRPKIEIRLDIIYNSPPPMPSSINTKKFDEPLFIGTGTSINQIILISRKYTYSDPTNYSYAIGGTPIPLNLTLSPSQTARMEGPCSAYPASGWTPRALDDPAVPDDGIIVDDGNNVVSINPSTGIGQSFTLRPGSYYCTITAPAYYVGSHRIRLASVDSAAVVLYGTPVIAGLGTTNLSTIKGLFTIKENTRLEVQHYCHYSNGPFDLGRPVSNPDGSFDMTFTNISCSRSQ